MQVIHILGNHRHIEVLLQSSYQFVSFIGLHIPALLAQHVVEVGH